MSSNGGLNQGSNPCIPTMKKLVMGTHWDASNLARDTMKRKTTKRQDPKPIFSTEKDYWDAYAKKSLSYKAIDLHNWKKYFREVLAKDPNSTLAQNMLKRCAEEENILTALKEDADKKSDALLLVKESSGSPKKPKR